MNQDEVVDAQDAAFFAPALTDPDAFQAGSGVEPDEAGDVDFDGDLDFDDIGEFVALVEGLSMAQFLTILQNPVPEPSALLLVILAGGCLPRSMRYRVGACQAQCLRYGPKGPHASAME